MGVHEAKIEKSSRGFSLRFPSKDSHKKIIIIIIKNKNKRSENPNPQEAFPATARKPCLFLCQVDALASP
jgi:hypothetical protein